VLSYELALHVVDIAQGRLVKNAVVAVPATVALPTRCATVEVVLVKSNALGQTRATDYRKMVGSSYKSSSCFSAKVGSLVKEADSHMEVK
jgi:hypothetical protein